MGVPIEMKVKTNVEDYIELLTEVKEKAEALQEVTERLNNFEVEIDATELSKD